MKGTANMNGVAEQGSVMPEGEYIVEIIDKQDKKSSSGDPMVSVKLAVAEGAYQGQWCWDNIIISNDSESPGYKILGRSKHFLHCIGEPYEGELVEWDSDKWLGRVCKVKIEHELPNEYHRYKKPVIAQYLLMDVEEQVQAQEVASDTPF